MKKFLTRTLGLLVTSSILLLWAIPISLAETSEEPEEPLTCDSATIWEKDELAKQLGAENSSFILTEIYEPIGGLDQKIKAGNLTVSQVFWKFYCTTTNPMEWIGDAAAPEAVATADGKPVMVSGYVPYIKENGTPGQCPTNYNDCSIVQIIIGQSGTAILKTYVALIYRWAAGIVGIVAVLVIVISGIQISIDQGSGENLSAAKTRIMQALAGLVILFLSSVILYTINPTFFQ